jgi:copper resistance protein C
MKRFHKYLPLIVIALLALPSIAHAHAFLDHADPKVGAIIATSPTEIKIWFTEEIEPAFSTIEVRDAAGNQLDKKDTHLDASDKTLLIVSVPNLPDGKFTVTWSVVATDTHHTQGSFTFTIKTKN